MGSRIYAIFSILLLQSYANATENITKNFEDLTTASKILDTINETPETIKVVESKEDGNNHKSENSQGQREKRDFDYGSSYFQSGFPFYPNYAPQYRPSTDEQSLVKIRQKLYKIIVEARQSSASQVQVSPPCPVVLSPFFTYANNNCKCAHVNGKRPPTQSVPLSENRPVTSPSKPSGTSQNTDNTMTTVDVGMRFSELGNDNDENDNIRPISLDPVPSTKALRRHPPPVEHGSSQADHSFSNRFDAPITYEGLVASSSDNSIPVKSDAIEFPDSSSPCDAAILRCCQLRVVTRDCFTSQGCKDPSVYGKPCNPNVISAILERFAAYYKIKNG